MSDFKREGYLLRRGPYLGEISALCFLHLPPHIPDSSLLYLLAGTGSELLLYDLKSGNLVKSFHVYRGIRVHGITSSSSCSNPTAAGTASSLEFRIAVFGERTVKLFSLSIGLEFQFRNDTGGVRDSVHLSLLYLLPKFSHWVLDVSFLKDGTSSLEGDCQFLAIGCCDNSVHFWNSLCPRRIMQVSSPDRCLLYSMQMWGDRVEILQIASGTIFNQILVWKVNPVNHVGLRSPVSDRVNMADSLEEALQFHGQQYEAVHICRLAGHEGSIFRIDWSCDGSRLISVSDDRSARLWDVREDQHDLNNSVEIPASHLAGPVLFGHNARVWDCCISDTLMVTAGEDCTCRVWGPDGNQLKVIKEHIGRGIWRCLYDPNSSLLVTAGFDSSIKSQQLHKFPLKTSGGPSGEVQELTDETMNFTVCIPRSSKHVGLMNSKSEYVRCLRFARENILYVATNNGYLYHAKLLDMGNVKWTELVRVSEAVAIVCMDLLSVNSTCSPRISEDWVACGDGKGKMTVVSIVNDDYTPKLMVTFTWPAGMERQLLGTYWCKSLGSRFIFTSDPRGTLSLWRLADPLQSVSHDSMRSSDVSLIAKFVSCFDIRIMCLDASFEQEVMVCGDLRGNLLLFPLSKHLLLGTSVGPRVEILISNHFKGAHGISSVCSISVASSSSRHVVIQSTGGDGCICYLEYDKNKQSLDFLGMKQVKELSLVQRVLGATSSNDLISGSYAIGFSSTNFLIWNLMTGTKVTQVPCGGWRRPYSYFLGDVPGIQNCFAFVKDEIIYIRSYWIHDYGRKIYPQNLHLQFHGREMHSVCFVCEDSSNLKQVLSSKLCWIATGCEDGTVRLTMYNPCVGEWCTSELLGEHVGGSSVRCLCYVSTIHQFAKDLTTIPAEASILQLRENPSLLISVGAKRVLTCWKRKSRTMELEEGTAATEPQDETPNAITPPSRLFSSMSFQWLSSDMPIKHCIPREEKERVVAEKTVQSDLSSSLEDGKSQSSSFLRDEYENDWRYLAVTAFLVNITYSRLSACFVVVACSDATLMLRALLLPYRLWFDVASLVPQSSPVLALQHAILPMPAVSDAHVRSKSVYLVIGGSTDGNITFWDLTGSVESFILSLSALQIEKSLNCQKRPRTGRGSQGGRWWKASSQNVSSVKPNGSCLSGRTAKGADKNRDEPVFCGIPSDSTDIDCVDTTWTEHRVWPLQILNGIHQSGVNCLHISSIKSGQGPNSGNLYCVLSGGDDQALHCLIFDLQMLPSSSHSENKEQVTVCHASEVGSTKNCIHYGRHPDYNVRFCYRNKVASAHSSAVKGMVPHG